MRFPLEGTGRGRPGEVPGRGKGVQRGPRAKRRGAAEQIPESGAAGAAGGLLQAGGADGGGEEELEAQARGEGGGEEEEVEAGTEGQEGGEGQTAGAGLRAEGRGELVWNVGKRSSCLERLGLAVVGGG